MKLKSKLRLALELCLVTSALPLLLLGCGGGGGGASGGQTPASQYLADLAGAGVRSVIAGYAPISSPYGYFPGYYASGYVESATFSGVGSHSYVVKQMTASGVWGVPSGWLANYYYLSSSGWALYPMSSVKYAAADGSHINVSSDILNASSQMTVSLIDLSGKSISANSAVPAMTSLGMASAVLPAAAIYPPGSYEYATVDTSTQTTTVYFLDAVPDYAVTTTAGPLSTPLNLASYQTHTTKADPVCTQAWGYALVNPAGTGNTYDVYNLSFSGPVPIGTLKNCQNASISASAAKIGTVDLSLVTVNGTQMIRFINLTGSFTPNDVLVDGLISQIPGDATGYFGSVSTASTSTSTSYVLNKTAMDAALTAWGVPTF